MRNLNLQRVTGNTSKTTSQTGGVIFGSCLNLRFE
ncbi:hypothetical protein Q648_01293 [Bartonella quintana JK 12]|uniref:Uncharacterized protein n=2 Tax=Bartonella quintana TaxID=803 RepID=W3TWW6_BARQI|nr:hypothetical protein Q651_00972 [Bartonella quintana BQ2-D70]ETS13021.1 hypothetical protein Q650_01311 [Bartonella quintana JK 73rel]ETS15094.1 hypothetical protein Q649_01312 [Bartonella quintana JK 73]ETS16564.1 hypothetical protein Q648_01293 [Bartonella quintana JK 12]ETS17355.1 hypothetical protein Q647_01307 [Bartonella quintana JK 7]KEC57625.1 hypothetical protein O93_01285 [Bartonella quintana JK 19]KEC60765.1 hypothetical protein O91_00947 [Bartonella quintana JK 31]KEC61392.1 h